MVKWAALLLLASATAAADLAHRVPLYPLYAGDPDGALLAWLVAGLAPEDDDQRLMLATLYQARGLADEARALLRPVAEGSGPLAPAARVHLARLDAHRPERVLAWLADREAPSELADTTAHLRLQALIRLGRLKAAESALRHAPQPARAYARYNLAAAWQARGETRRARRQLRRLVREGEGGGPVLRALADEARLALAFLDLGDGHPRRAERTLLAVHRDGPQAPRALLGLAWARLTDGRPADALAPLARLTALDDPLAAEGRLALAHAYERLGRPGAALAAYRTAERDSRNRLTALERRLARLADGHLPPAFDAAPEALAADPEGRALHQALDDPGVQAAYRAWMRAGERLQRLHAARERLTALAATLAERRRRLAPRLAELRARQRLLTAQLRHQRRAALRHTALAVGQRPGEPLVDAGRRLRRLEARLAHLTATLDDPRPAALLARLEGLEDDLLRARREAARRLARALRRHWQDERRRLQALRDQARYAQARLLDPGLRGGDAP